MDWKKVVEALTIYEGWFGEDRGLKPVRNPRATDLNEALQHCYWMCQEVKKWESARLEKAFRWLGFIQGVLWTRGVTTLDTLKDHNKP